MGKPDKKYLSLSNLHCRWEHCLPTDIDDYVIQDKIRPIVYLKKDEPGEAGTLIGGKFVPNKSVTLSGPWRLLRDDAVAALENNYLGHEVRYLEFLKSKNSLSPDGRVRLCKPLRLKRIDLRIPLTEIEELEQDNPDQHNNHRDLDKPQTRGRALREDHAQKREQILGAAFALLAAYPDECKNEKGGVEATKVAKLIDSKSGLFWPKAETNEPPLSLETIENHLRDWLKKVR